MQDQFANYFEEWELKQPQICAGSEEYQQNILSFKTTIAKLKTPEGAKEMQVGGFQWPILQLRFYSQLTKNA